MGTSNRSLHSSFLSLPASSQTSHPCHWWIYPTYLLVRFMFPIPRYVTKPDLIRLFLLSIVGEEKFGQVGQEFK